MTVATTKSLFRNLRLVDLATNCLSLILKILMMLIGCFNVLKVCESLKCFCVHCFFIFIFIFVGGGDKSAIWLLGIDRVMERPGDSPFPPNNSKACLAMLKNFQRGEIPIEVPWWHNCWSVQILNSGEKLHTMHGDKFTEVVKSKPKSCRSIEQQENVMFISF